VKGEKLVDERKLVWVWAALALVCLTALWACQRPSDSGLYRVEVDPGMSRPYWLEVQQYGEWTRMALVFGWFDDQDACAEWADWLHEEYYQRDSRAYRCVAAN